MTISRGFIAVVVAAAIAALGFHVLRIPGAWLFGPLAVSAFAAVKGWQAVKFTNPVYIAGQCVIGTALGSGFSGRTLSVIPQHAGTFTFAVVFILATSLLNGWLLSHFTRLDAGTSFLGTMPGGASAMAAMSDSLGADTRLVTAIQYVRLLVILASLALVASILKAHMPTAVQEAASAPPPAFFQQTPFVAWKFISLLGLAAAGWLVGMKTRLPAGAFLVPTLLYSLLAGCDIELGGWPLPVLATAYGIMGLQIGGRFHPSTIGLIKSVILPVIGTTLVLLVGSVILAFFVEHLMHIGLINAYLAATPGGLDSVAAVATDLRVDTTVVISMHLVRLLCVLLLGPWLVRWCVRTFPSAPVASSPIPENSGGSSRPS
jgi:membrane AbrB-like protein